jgi:hypothetical protein
MKHWLINQSLAGSEGDERRDQIPELFRILRPTTKLSRSMVDCCARIQIPGSGLRLEERSEERNCGGEFFTLYECPSCGALWAGHDVFWDHGTWYRKEYIRVADREAFEALVESTRAANAAAKAVASVGGPEPGRLTTDDIARALQLAATIGREKEG